MSESTLIARVPPEHVAPRVIGSRVEIRPGRGLNLTHSPAASDTTLFFAHGGGGNQDQWRYPWNLPQVAGHTRVAWDLLGHGASDKPRAASAYAWEELVADQQAIIERFAGTRNIFVAHSFGTALTLSALLRLRERKADISIDGILLLGTQWQAPASRSQGIWRLPAWALEWLRPRLAKGFREAAWHGHTDAGLVAYEEQLTEHNPLYVFKALLSQADWIPRQGLEQLQAPVTILAGEQDRVTPAAGAVELQRQLPGARLEILPECAHQVMLERPDAVALQLSALLAAP